MLTSYKPDIFDCLEHFFSAKDLLDQAKDNMTELGAIVRRHGLQKTDTSLEDRSYWKDCHYIYKSLYFYSLKQWMKVFPKEQFLILQSEEFYGNPAIVLKQVFEFLGVPDFQLRDYPKYNGANYHPGEDVVHRRLPEYFQPHNRKLAEYLNREFVW